MLFTLPKLPYSYEDFFPSIDKETMEIHYNKHHKNYIDNLNKAIYNTDMKNLSIEEILRRSHIESSVIQNNSGGVYNHNLFWKILIPSLKFVDISSTFKKVLIDNFGSFDIFKKKFNNTAINLFGSGWTWLCVSNNDKKLTICSTNNQDNPIMYVSDCDGIPIFGIDVWEHAYYLKYQNRRIDYISNFWKIVNWKEIEKNYENAISY